MEPAQHAPEWTVGDRWNQKIPTDEWRWQHSISVLTGYRKELLRGKLIAISIYIKKSEIHQINDLMMFLKDLENQ